MGNKKSRQRKADTVSSGTRLAVELGLDPAVWSVGVGFAKGFLTGDRYSFVSVCHLPSGHEKKAEFYSTGKAAARRDAATTARRLVKELQQG